MQIECFIGLILGSFVVFMVISYILSIEKQCKRMVQSFFKFLGCSLYEKREEEVGTYM